MELSGLLNMKNEEVASMESSGNLMPTSLNNGEVSIFAPKTSELEHAIQLALKQDVDYSEQNEVSSGTASSEPNLTKETAQSPDDICSQKGQFGWVQIGEEDVPYIKRNTSKYCSVRIIEMKLISKYLKTLTPEVYSCITIRSYYITHYEATLLSDINIRHSDHKFGSDPFTTKDLVVRLDDAQNFYIFLDLCFGKLTNPTYDLKERCGFVRINNDSIVPYATAQGIKYVPLFCFEGDMQELKRQATVLEPWDMAYLSFCCKVQGIRNELFCREACKVVNLRYVQAYFPQGTIFTEFWPTKVVGRNRLLTCYDQLENGSFDDFNVRRSVSSWLKAPLAPVLTAQSTVVPEQVVINNWPRPIRTANHFQPQPGTSRYQQLPQNHTISSPMNNNTILQRSQITIQPNVAILNNQIQRNRSITIHQNPTIQFNQQIQRACTSQPNVSIMNQSQRNRSITIPPNLTYHQQRACNTSQSNVPIMNNQRQRGRSVTVQPNVAGLNHLQLQRGCSTSQSNVVIANSGNQRCRSITIQPNVTLLHPQSQSILPNNYSMPMMQPSAPSNSLRYFRSSSDIIDLCTPPHSPQRSVASTSSTKPLLTGNPMNPRPVTHKLTTTVNGLIMGKVVPIPEIYMDQQSTRNHSVQPYKVQKALVQNKLVPCINIKPYIYSELLMTIGDLILYFFPLVTINKCHEVLQNVLQITLFSANYEQRVVLRSHGKCSSLDELVPLIQLKDVIQYMPQLRYVLENHNVPRDPSATKRQRTS